MAEFSLQALHDEIEADSENIGYKEAGGVWKGDQVIADLINNKNLLIDRESVEMEAIRGATTYEAYDALQADEQEWIRWMTPNSGGFQSTADMKLQLAGRTLTSNGASGAGDNDNSFWSATHSDEIAPIMLALIEVAGSRAEVLWGERVAVSLGDVGRAANL